MGLAGPAGAGFVVPCEAISLAAALERLLAAPGLAADMGQRGLDLVPRRF